MGKRSASRDANFTKSFERDNLKGGRGRGRRRRQPATPDLFRRLRRLELAVAKSETGLPRDFDLDGFVKSVLQLNLDAALQESRSADQRGEVPVPQEGAPSREAARAPGVDWGPEGGEGELRKKPPTS